MEILLLLLISFLPGIVLLVYILYMDRNEREPIGLVLKTLGRGALSTIPAILIEMGMEYIHPIFTDSAPKTLETAIVQSFIQIAPAEEFCKLMAMLLFIWKNPEFNEENDGIVYVSASALGFAIFENIFYVVSGGFGVGVLRSITAMPLHCFTGVIMGYFVGLAKFSSTQSEAKKKIIIGFTIAVIFHGVYDTFALSGTSLAALLIPTVILLWVTGIKFLKKGRELSLERWGDLTSSGHHAPAITQQPNEGFVTDNFSSEFSSQYSTEFSEDTYKKEEVIEQPQIIKQPTGKGKWKIWISRPVLGLSIILWIVLIVGI
ncbi:MAG: PrsW family intramembrane metalloprotease, partial [Leptospiraceae bacterium]|nr:PrsW family intramembrane metalloprotease [Leptospiraceae bacterium]